MAFSLLAERVRVLRRHPVVTAVAEAAFAGTVVAVSGGAESPMLPYLLAPGLAVGLVGTWRDVLLTAAGSLAGLAGGRIALELGGGPRAAGTLLEYVGTAAQWVVLGLAFGVVAGWAQRLVASTPLPVEDRYAEARGLLEQLRGVTRRLPGGLDLTSSAEALLTACAELVPSHRSAVLVQPSSGALVPAAVRGTPRVPWRTPLSEPGPLQRAWEGVAPLVDRRHPDERGRRHGSALAVLPLASNGTPFGLLILESYDEHAFDGEQVEQLARCAEEGALRLETALLFEEVRSTVTLEERDRLAREMHDGVAQELAYVGYQLDDLRLQAEKVDAGLSGRLSEVRKDLTRLISDIRLSITDLKTSVGSERGLGAALTGYVRAVASAQKVAVHVSLHESAFRLPSEHEVLLFQVAQAVAQDLRKAGQVRNLWVTLRVDPPSARLVVEHDGRSGPGGSLDLREYAEHLTRVGGTVSTTAGRNGGVRVEVVLEGR